MRPARLLQVRGHEGNKLRLLAKIFCGVQSYGRFLLTNNFADIKHPTTGLGAIRPYRIFDL